MWWYQSHAKISGFFNTLVNADIRLGGPQLKALEYVCIPRSAHWPRTGFRLLQPFLWVLRSWYGVLMLHSPIQRNKFLCILVLQTFWSILVDPLTTSYFISYRKLVRSWMRFRSKVLGQVDSFLTWIYLHFCILIEPVRKVYMSSLVACLPNTCILIFVCFILYFHYRQLLDTSWTNTYIKNVNTGNFSAMAIKYI